MTTARRATSADTDELIRLREVMLRTVQHADWNDDWREPARRSLLKRLDEPDPTIVAYVVDRPGGTGLAACAVAVVEERLGNPRNPSGVAAYIFNVATDTDQRRRGFGTACMTGLLGWLREHGVGQAELRASEDGRPMYERLGFARTPDPAMRLTL